MNQTNSKINGSKVTISFNYDPANKYSWNVKGNNGSVEVPSENKYPNLAALLIDPKMIGTLVNLLGGDPDDVPEYVAKIFELASDKKFRKGGKFLDNNPSTKTQRAIVSFRNDPICDYSWSLMHKKKWEGTSGSGGCTSLADLLFDYGLWNTLFKCLGGGIPHEMLEYARQKMEDSRVPFTDEQIKSIEEWAGEQGIPFSKK